MVYKDLLQNKKKIEDGIFNKKIKGLFLYQLHSLHKNPDKYLHVFG